MNGDRGDADNGFAAFVFGLLVDFLELASDRWKVKSFDSQVDSLNGKQFFWQFRFDNLEAVIGRRVHVIPKVGDMPASEFFQS